MPLSHTPEDDDGVSSQFDNIHHSFIFHENWQWYKLNSLDYLSESEKCYDSPKSSKYGFKNILKAPNLTSTSVIHCELDMLTLEKRRLMHSATQMFKVNASICPEKKTLSLFKKRYDISERSTRAMTRGDFDIPR